MAVLVDYRCQQCGSTVERQVASPPAPDADCELCGGPARRVWAPVGIVGRARRPPAGPEGAVPGRPAPVPSCRTNQDIPGLCMLSPTASRALVARARGDNRALDAELAYQERMQKDAPGTLTVGGHGHGHAPAPAGSAPAAPAAGAHHDHHHDNGNAQDRRPT